MAAGKVRNSFIFSPLTGRSLGPSPRRGPRPVPNGLECRPGARLRIVAGPGRTAASLENVADRQRSFRRDIGPVPPAATERLEQGDRIGETRGPGLGETAQGLLIGLLRVEH